MGEVVLARISPTLPPHPLALCCNYLVSKCPSASIVATSTLRVNFHFYAYIQLRYILESHKWYSAQCWALFAQKLQVSAFIYRAIL